MPVGDEVVPGEGSAGVVALGAGVRAVDPFIVEPLPVVAAGLDPVPNVGAVVPALVSAPVPIPVPVPSPEPVPIPVPAPTPAEPGVVPTCARAPARPNVNGAGRWAP
jgi:hypothetical protein